jgi:hypothetical protein
MTERRGLTVCFSSAVVLLILLWSNAIAGDEGAVDRELVVGELYYIMCSGGGDMTLHQIEAEWDKNPEKMIEMWKGLRVVMSSILGHLGYGTGPFVWNFGERETTALLRFQSALGIPGLGGLDSLTIHHLFRAQASLHKARIALPPKSFSAMAGYIAVEGTWRAMDFEAAFPINAVTIGCYRDRKSCETVTVDFISEDLKQISINRDYYQVMSWGTDRVVAQSDSPCRQHLLTVNSSTEDVVLLSQDKKGCGKDTLETTTSHVVNASYWDEEFKEIEQLVYGEKDFYERLIRANMKSPLWDE